MKAYLLEERVTACKKNFNSFEIPVELTMLTQMGVESEGFMSHDISKTFLVPYVPIDNTHFSKAEPVSWSFSIAFSLCAMRILSVPMKTD